MVKLIRLEFLHFVESFLFLWFENKTFCWNCKYPGCVFGLRILKLLAYINLHIVQLTENDTNRSLSLACIQNGAFGSTVVENLIPNLRLGVTNWYVVEVSGALCYKRMQRVVHDPDVLTDRLYFWINVTVFSYKSSPLLYLGNFSNSLLNVGVFVFCRGRKAACWMWSLYLLDRSTSVSTLALSHGLIVEKSPRLSLIILLTY